MGSTSEFNKGRTSKNWKVNEEKNENPVIIRHLFLLSDVICRSIKEANRRETQSSKTRWSLKMIEVVRNMFPFPNVQSRQDTNREMTIRHQVIHIRVSMQYRMGRWDSKEGLFQAIEKERESNCLSRSPSSESSQNSLETHCRTILDCNSLALPIQDKTVERRKSGMQFPLCLFETGQLYPIDKRDTHIQFAPNMGICVADA